MSHPSRGAWIEIAPFSPLRARFPSHPSRGAWIEILSYTLMAKFCLSHPSRGAWIEIGTENRTPSGVQSHPSRGAWIEIALCRPCACRFPGRTPHGVRGLKSPGVSLLLKSFRRTPHGVRGLKFLSGGWHPGCCLSHPSRGAWIEISPWDCQSG